jgi:hypothetical protein
LKTHSVMTHFQLKVDSLRILHWLKLRRPPNPANRERANREKANRGRDRQVKDHLARGKDRQVKGNRA